MKGTPMRKIILPALLLGAVLLAACSSQNTPGKKQQVSGPPMDGCKVVDVIPQPDPTLAAMIPAVTEKDHILGAKEAKVTFIEYSDYQ
jgi:hypothetical protein